MPLKEAGELAVLGSTQIGGPTGVGARTLALFPSSHLPVALSNGWVWGMGDRTISGLPAQGLGTEPRRGQPPLTLFLKSAGHQADALGYFP